MFTCRVHLQSQRKLRTYSPGSRSEGTYRRWYLQCFWQKILSQIKICRQLTNEKTNSLNWMLEIVKYIVNDSISYHWVQTYRQWMQRTNEQWQRCSSRAINLNIVNDIAPSSPIAAAFLIWRQERISRPPVQDINVKRKNKNNLRTNWPRNVCELMLDSNSWSQGFMG